MIPELSVSKRMNPFLSITYKGDVTVNRLGSYAGHIVI